MRQLLALLDKSRAGFILVLARAGDVPRRLVAVVETETQQRRSPVSERERSGFGVSSPACRDGSLSPSSRSVGASWSCWACEWSRWSTRRLSMSWLKLLSTGYESPYSSWR